VQFTPKEEVAGSNPAASTNEKKDVQLDVLFGLVFNLINAFSALDPPTEPRRTVRLRQG